MERDVADQCYRSGRPLPNWLKHAPSLWPNLVFFYSAFCELTTCRSVGFGPGPIPWTAVMQYADAEDLRGCDRAELLYLIRSMDRAYLEHAKAESDKKVGQKPKGARGRRIGGD